MSQPYDFAEIRRQLSSAKLALNSDGVHPSDLLIDALSRLTDAVEQMDRQRAKIETNVAKRLGKMMAGELKGDFIRSVILDAEPNYPYGKDDPDQLTFDKMVDDALRDALRDSD
ncbi:hypothetical protein D2N39_11440 [Gemmobacter lutimaris]|uniref:Uncharacterized protein n=1 Tax=Gemmobacter lutimaris TaxID=2306023 RepID=A0A398BQ64_9RHOB|nr:hypothetical protein [Gemmobacter lutimaris]RID91844.1 hypothetical protein D2N39_11440 [Gemmobacter lutimaris]